MTFFRGLAVALACLLLVACAGGPATITQTNEVDGLTVALEHPQQTTLLQATDLVIVLTRDGQPVDGADVYLDLDMPSMPMGSNQPVADPAGSGRYKVTTAFSMIGDWIVSVHINVDGTDYSTTFDQVVAEQ